MDLSEIVEISYTTRNGEHVLYTSEDGYWFVNPYTGEQRYPFSTIDKFFQEIGLYYRRRQFKDKDVQFLYENLHKLDPVTIQGFRTEVFPEEFLIDIIRNMKNKNMWRTYLLSSSPKVANEAARKWFESYVPGRAHEIYLLKVIYRTFVAQPYWEEDVCRTITQAVRELGVEFWFSPSIFKYNDVEESYQLFDEYIYGQPGTEDDRYERFHQAILKEHNNLTLYTKWRKKYIAAQAQKDNLLSGLPSGWTDALIDFKFDEVYDMSAFEAGFL